jgi:hypothetical protein
MDSATRVELSYMNRRPALPYETWNYAHNRDYLCYIQEQLGRAEDSMRGAKDLIAAPVDPEMNPAEAYFTQFPLMRALVKFERWGEILDGKTLKPMKDPFADMIRVAAEVMALVETGRDADDGRGGEEGCRREHAAGLAVAEHPPRGGSVGASGGWGPLGRA